MTSVMGEKMPPSALNTSDGHRRLLANLNTYGGSHSDNDATTDEEELVTRSPEQNFHAESILGFSISRTQSRMKSAQTPASEKAKAMDPINNSFFAEPEMMDSNQSGTQDRYRIDSGGNSRMDYGNSSCSTEPAAHKTMQTPTQRSSISRMILGDSEKTGRKRSSSGPSAILGSIRRILPDSPSSKPSGTRQTNDPGSVNAQQTDGRLARSLSDPDTSEPVESGSSVSSPMSARAFRSGGMDGNVSSTSSNEPLSRPKSLRRITSENSLYLRHVVTGGSEFDDTSAFANIADMPNSRFKAITDSFQDTSLRHPRLPSISLPSPTVFTNRSESEITRQNTEANTGRPRGEQLSKSGSSNTSAQTEYVPPKSTKHPIFRKAMSQVTGDLVLMGGYRGSILRSADPPHQQVWVPVKVGLNLRKVDLEVGLTHEDEERMEEKIIPSGILDHIGPVDIARRLLRKMRKSPQVRANQLRIHDWGYDWRLSPHFLSQKLITFLESLQCNQPEVPQERRGALVVAHSLGGLVTRYAVNQRPELFSGVIYAGVPQNCCNILGPLRNGDDVLLSSRVLTAQVNFTLRTSYALLPEDGRCFLNKDTGERYDVDFFDVNSWDEYRLTPCINPALPVIMKRRSIVGSISESITSFTPSLPSINSSWFSTKESSPSRDFKSVARDARDDIHDAAKRVTDQIPTSDSVGQGLEPSMKSGHKSSVATNVTIPRDQAYEYLERTLAEVKLFKQNLSHQPEHQANNSYPPQAIIFGKSMPTVYGAKVASREAIKFSDAYDDLAFAAGDGVVLASAAQLPIGYRCVKGGRVESDRGHVGILGDLEGMGRCLDAVVQGRRRGIGSGKPIQGEDGKRCD